MTFAAFYSDPHFGHANVIGYCKRPFSSPDEMRAAMVARYNDVVGPGDWCLWLGDCFLGYGEPEARALLSEMNGVKALVLGNHDKSKAWMARVGFVFVVDHLQMHIGGRKVLACHYPYADAVEGGPDPRYLDRYPARQKGQVLLHGHTHSARRRHGATVHVGVDAWDYGPAPFAEVEALVRAV